VPWATTFSTTSTESGAKVSEAGTCCCTARQSVAFKIGMGQAVTKSEMARAQDDSQATLFPTMPQAHRDDP
jgi:hypothetical protein